MIAIVNYGIGNVSSVIKAFSLFHPKVVFTDSITDLKNADAIVLPGVSSFGPAIKNLEQKNLKTTIINEINKGKLFLGICIGIQILFEKSEESPTAEGLSIFKGNIIRFPNNFTVPHIGWNNVNIINKNNPLFKNIENNEFFYFVHSYYPEPSNKSIIAATTDYSNLFYTSSINKDNVFAVQFHPEKSQTAGLKIIKNFVDII
jgi:imidazole glycerol-phosphate synthase subunit HisH